MEEVTQYLFNIARSKVGATLESMETEFKPAAVKWNVCYIVAAVVIRDASVLMIKESKKSAYGLWYLPAGRMEANETMEEAVKREVKEEALVDVDVLSLLSIESNSPFWCHDVIQLIEKGESWCKTKQSFQEAHLLPIRKSHAICIVRVYLIFASKDGLFMFIGKSKEGFTEKVIQSKDENLVKIIEVAVQNNGFADDFTSHGVISLEHTGKEYSKSDGFLLHVLAQAKSRIPKEELCQHWEPLNDAKMCTSLGNIIEKRLCPPIS